MRIPTPIPLLLLLCALLVLAPRVQARSTAVQGSDPQQTPEQVSPLFDPEESLLVSTLIRTAEPPPARSVRIIHLLHQDVPNAPPGLERTRERAVELAATLRRRALAGEPMAELARVYSAARNAVTGGVLGTFAQGILAPAFDQFLFEAEVGDISAPIELPTGVFLLERVERWAAARTIMVKGTDESARAAMAAVQARLAAGEDFAALAEELSDDAITAARGGALAIFERGPEDRLLKAAAFDAEVGEVVGPIESPIGLHLVQRVAEDALPESLRERNFVRLAAIVLLQSDTPLQIPAGDRPSPITAELARELYRRLEAGEDFEALARVHNEDFGGGRERAGDLGWLHFRQPGLSPALRQAFTLKPGELLEPQPTNFGWMLVKRMR